MILQTNFQHRNAAIQPTTSLSLHFFRTRMRQLRLQNKGGVTTKIDHRPTQAEEGINLFINQMTIGRDSFERQRLIGIDQNASLNFNDFPDYFIQIQVQKLFKLFRARCLTQGSYIAPQSRYLYSLYFLKGMDQRLLSHDQASQVSTIIEENNLQTSCLLYNQSEALRKYNTWNQVFPWIKPHYAIKSNPSLPLLNDLHANGSGFDCASRAELESVLSVGAHRDQVIYSNPIKDESDLVWAENNGIKYTTADSIDQLIKIKQLAPKMQILWRIAIKEEASDNLATPFSGKFGDDIESEEKIHQRMKEIKNMGIRIKGIHFHCGSGMHGSSAFGKAVLLARECLRIGRQYGHQMSIMDVGGGFPAGDLNKKTIDALKVTKNDPLGYKVIAEPGRHFSSNSFYLLTRVLGKRTKNNKPCFHLNESLYHSFNCNLMDGFTLENNNDQFYLALDQGKPVNVSSIVNSTLFGMTCDGMDIIAKNMGVPADLKVADWLCISGMGAYTYGCRSNFNGMKSTERVIRFPTELEMPVEEREPAFQLSF